MSIVVMVNEKIREGVPAWAVFLQNQDKAGELNPPSVACMRQVQAQQRLLRASHALLLLLVPLLTVLFNYVLRSR